MNALKHGATSPRLLNEQESKNYQNFINALRRHHKSADPLVVMQHERIARLKIQLERVQEQMDSLHRVAAINSSPFNRAAQAMALNEGQMQLAASLMDNLTGADWPNEIRHELIDKTQFRLYLELGEFADDFSSRLSSHDDFLTMAPHFCNYILSQADERMQPLQEYLLAHLPEVPSSDAPTKTTKSKKSTRGSSAGGLGALQYSVQSSWQEAQITDVSIPLLKSAMGWFCAESKTYLQDLSRAQHIMQVMNEVIEHATPDPLAIDRLMRYQTTLQRQLSSAMGELLALLDREKLAQ